MTTASSGKGATTTFTGTTVIPSRQSAVQSKVVSEYGVGATSYVVGGTNTVIVNTGQTTSIGGASYPVYGVGAVNSSTTPPPSGPSPTADAVYTHPEEVKYNLPPHKWSLPLDQTPFNNGVTDRPANNTDFHSKRRAVMWFYNNYDAVKSGTIGNNLGTTVGDQPTLSSTDGTVALTNINMEDYLWGFQFLWNPEQITTTVTRSSNVTPSVLDSHAGLSGLFTAMEQVNFTIVIDRVNDFACAKGITRKPNYFSYLNSLTKYYNENRFGKTYDTPGQIDELLRKGTMADIEYIFRMINGSGQSEVDAKGNTIRQYVWANGLNRVTADIGYLAPTAIGLMVSPGNPDGLSFVGWVESLSITHTKFTETMIPIHSQVEVSFNAFSRSALTSKSLTS